MPKDPSDKRKVDFLANHYFGVSNNQHDDVNPFPITGQGFDNFLKSNVGDLRWGSDASVRRHSKERFSFTFSRVLREMGVKISSWDVLAELEDDNRKNQEACEAWAGKAEFPPIHS
jgi:hypothetical protein